MARRRAVDVAVVAAFTAVLAAFVLTPDWKQLPGGVWLVVGAALGVAVVVGRVWVVVVVLLVPVLSALIDSASGYDVLNYSIFGGGALVVVLGLGLLARALLVRVGRAPTRILRSVGVLGAGVALALAAVGVVRNARVVDVRPRAPLTIDERTGEFRGVRLGGRVAELRRRVRLASVSSSELNLFSGPSTYTEVYRVYSGAGAFVLARNGAVREYLAYDPNAQTADGVGVGDSSAVAERAGAKCTGIALGSDSNIPLYRACTRRLSSGAYIWYGGDPIDCLWVSRAATPGQGD